MQIVEINWKYLPICVYKMMLHLSSILYMLQPLNRMGCVWKSGWDYHRVAIQAHLVASPSSQLELAWRSALLTQGFALLTFGCSSSPAEFILNSLARLAFARLLFGCGLSYRLIAPTTPANFVPKFWASTLRVSMYSSSQWQYYSQQYFNFQL